jgi:Ca2+-binding RTX toxin-like protein
MAIIIGTIGNDELWDTSSADLMLGLGGNDVLQASAGADVLDGGNGTDDLLGGAGNDNLSGGNSTDWLWGQEGNDRLWGGNQSDMLYGGNGVDSLGGGAGSDTMNGGGGTDHFLMATSLKFHDVITDFDSSITGGTDKLHLGAGDTFSKYDSNRDGFWTTADAAIASNGAGGIELTLEPTQVIELLRVPGLTFVDVIDG